MRKFFQRISAPIADRAIITGAAFTVFFQGNASALVECIVTIFVSCNSKADAGARTRDKNASDDERRRSTR
jgi:hypothetical protein